MPVTITACGNSTPASGTIIATTQVNSQEYQHFILTDSAGSALGQVAGSPFYARITNMAASIAMTNPTGSVLVTNMAASFAMTNPTGSVLINNPTGSMVVTNLTGSAAGSPMFVVQNNMTGSAAGSPLFASITNLAGSAAGSPLFTSITNSTGSMLVTNMAASIVVSNLTGSAAGSPLFVVQTNMSGSASGSPIFTSVTNLVSASISNVLSACLLGVSGSPLPVVSQNGTIWVSGSYLTVNNLQISASGAASTVMIPGVVSQQIRLLAVTYTVSTCIAVSWRSGSTGGVDLIQPMYFGTNGGMDVNRMPHGYIAQWASGCAAVINLSAAASCRGFADYVNVPG